MGCSKISDDDERDELYVDSEENESLFWVNGMKYPAVDEVVGIVTETRGDGVIGEET